MQLFRREGVDGVSNSGSLTEPSMCASSVGKLSDEAIQAGTRKCTGAVNVKREEERAG